MGSIPLPALDVRPPAQQESPIQSIGQLLQLKNMQAQGQTQQLQQEALRQENAQREQQAKDLQATTAAARDWDGKDYDALSKSILKNGGSANAAMTIQQHGLTIKKTVSDIAATDATTGSKNLETFIGKHKAVGDALEGIEKVPDDQLHQAAAAKIDELAKGGILEPAMAQQLMQGVQSMQDPTALRGQIDIFAKASMGAKAAAEQEKSTAETRQKNAQAALEEMQAKYGTPATMEAKYLAIQQKLNQKQQLTADESSFAKAYEKNKTLGAQYNFNLNNAPNGGGNGGPLSNAVIDSLAAPGAKLKLTDVLPSRAPISVRQAAINQILAKYPNYSTADYDIEKGVMKSATSGDIGKNLTSFNTAIEHAKQLQEAATALDPSDVRTFNKISNTLGVEMGSDKVTNFNVIKNALAGEISKVFKGGQATDAEIKAVEEPFHAANSPAQLKGAINSAIRLMNSKRDALKEQVEKGKKGEANFGDSSNAPTAKTGLQVGQSVTVKGKTMKVTAVHPDGSFDAQ